MREIPREKIILYVIAIAIAIAATPFIGKLNRTKGKSILGHAAFLVATVLMIVLLPEWVQDELFSPGGVLVVGTIIPIYESIVAACSLVDYDSRSWLQFWIAQSCFSFATEFMDDITHHLPNAGEHWYEFEFFFTAWLMLPFTDGSGLLYQKITIPYLAPTVEKIKSKVEGWVEIVFVTVNTSYMWIMWYAFLRLDEDERRFLVVALGTVYPILASTVAMTTKSTSKIKEEHFWLTYWASYNILFMTMDYAENFVGRIRGFYSLCAMATLYLFLPMFQGAEVVFRRVLVPLSGQYENMLLQDAMAVKMGIEGAIPTEHREAVLARAAQVFSKKAN